MTNDDAKADSTLAFWKAIRCHEADALGRSGLRDLGECALYAYLPLIVDAIDEVRALPRSG